MLSIEWKNGKVRLLDQTRLPLEEIYIETSDVDVLAEAIRSLRIRGAPALGIAAGFGMALGALRFKSKDLNEFLAHLSRVEKLIGSTRPTAVNLFWALDRIRKKISNSHSPDIPALQVLILHEALEIQKEDIATCKAISMNGLEVIPNDAGVLTHCNAGALATGDYGTSLGVIIQAHRAGKKIRVYADETRPLFQGSRLTMWELQREGVDATLITDSTAAFVMQQGKIQVVITGADRIAANGDTANKIGTYGVAVLAAKHNIPFYIAAPYSTIDPATPDGSAIPIEERNPDEVTQPCGIRIAPKGVKVYSPTFDITPQNLISGIITEHGILRPPYQTSINKMLAKQPHISPE